MFLYLNYDFQDVIKLFLLSCVWIEEWCIILHKTMNGGKSYFLRHIVNNFILY